MQLLEINSATMMLVLFVGQLFSTVLVIAYTASANRSRALKHFLMSKLTQSVAWFLIGLQVYFPGMALIAVANILLFLGVALELSAFLIIKGRYTARLRSAMLAYLAVSMLLFALAAAAGFSESARITLSSMILAALMGWPLTLLLLDKGATFLQRTITVTYIITALLLVFRGIAAQATSYDFSLTTTNIFNTWMFVLLYLHMISGSVGFILLEKEKVDQLLRHEADYDFLTGLCNRRSFDQQAVRLIARGKARREAISCLLMDLDDFKAVNDRFGHAAGDETLRHAAETLRGQLRPGDLIARYGGEEFFALLPDTDAGQAARQAERLRRALDNHAPLRQGQPGCTLSIGTYTLPPGGDAPVEDLYRHCDRALYRAKRLGKNRVEAAGPEDEPQEVTHDPEKPAQPA